MSYTVEKIGAAEQARIHADADERKRGELQMRGGFFALSDDLTWTVDHARNLYLVRAPRLDPKSMEGRFFMFFKGRLYALRVLGPSGPDVVIEDAVDPSDLAELQKEITEAFRVQKYRRFSMTPIFVKE